MSTSPLQLRTALVPITAGAAAAVIVAALSGPQQVGVSVPRSASYRPAHASLTATVPAFRDARVPAAPALAEPPPITRLHSAGTR